MAASKKPAAAAPVQEAAPAKATKAAKNAKAPAAAVAAKPAKPAKAAEPAASTKPATSTKPAKAAKPAPSSKPAKAADSTKPAKPATSPKPATAAAPAAAAKAPAKKAAAKPSTKTAAVKDARTKLRLPTKPPVLVVREDETPWTKAELATVRKELEREVERLHGELAAAEADIADLVRDSGDGAGDDQADAGSKTFEREQEMSLANNFRDMLLQTERALARIDDGTYGVCEVCAKPVGKLRLQAFPRATLCMTCKQAEERM